MYDTKKVLKNILGDKTSKNKPLINLTRKEVDLIKRAEETGQYIDIVDIMKEKVKNVK